MCSIDQQFRDKVKHALSPYLANKYPTAAKNPVLLLNFLYQHSIIPKPEYNIRPDPNKPFHFIGSCAVGPLKTEVDADSKKSCKNKAAQNILDLFLQNEKMDIDNYTEYSNGNLYNDETCKINFAIKFMSINGNEDPNWKRSIQDQYPEMKRAKNFYDDDLSGILLFEDKKSNHDTELNKETKLYNTSLTIVQPQCEKPSDIPMDKLMCQRLSAPSQINSLFVKFENKVVEPQGENVGVPLTKSTWTTLSASGSENRLNSSDNTKSSLQPVVRKSIQNSENQKYHPSEKMLIDDNLYNDFFDPFLRMRPKVKGLTNTSQKEKPLIMGKENANGETGINEARSKFPMELGQNKTPFQILQEKAVKNFKLIPRSRIEKTDNGFSCTLILDVHTGHGEGRTKKEAKLKAAEHLLQILPS